MSHASRTGKIEVGKPILVDGFTVRYELKCSPGMRKYFSSRDMFVTYDADMSDVPEALLLIPFLSSAAPIAWSLGAELRAPCIDVEFLHALSEIKESFRRFHPAGDWSGEVRGDLIVDTSRSYRVRRRAILFSGGVDSVTSAVVHQDENPRLVTVWGADLGLAQHRPWEQVSAATRTFAQHRSMDISFVKTNFRTFFNSYKLNARSQPSFPNWYSGFQQGLGLVGLCAPLSCVHELESIYIPSTHTADFARPWGSHPEIDNHIRWGSTQAIHDGYELSRQNKLQALAKYIREEDPGLSLRVCWAKGANCSRCEKCSITMIGLVIEGLDPNHHGFIFGPQTLSYIRSQLENGGFNVSHTLVWILKEIQQTAYPRSHGIEESGCDEFLSWLRGVSVESFRERRGHSVRKSVTRFLENRPEPLGRTLRKAIGHPFP